MTLDDWILALHLLSAAALLAAMTIFSALIVAGWREERPAAVLSYMRISLIANGLVMIGVAGTLVFGIWLALSFGNYDLWDGWIVAAIVLWAVASALGGRSGKLYAPIAERARQGARTSPDVPDPELGAMLRSREALWLHVGSTVLVVAILALMIWKPGA